MGSNEKSPPLEYRSPFPYFIFRVRSGKSYRKCDRVTKIPFHFQFVPWLLLAKLFIRPADDTKPRADAMKRVRRKRQTKRRVINNGAPTSDSNSFNPNEFFQFAVPNCAFDFTAPSSISSPRFNQRRRSVWCQKGDNLHPSLVVTVELSI